MSENDTERLLRECDLGTCMAAGSIRNLLDKAEDPKLRALLCTALTTHEEIGNAIHARLNSCGEPAKQPPRAAQLMARMKVEIKSAQGDAAHAVAEMLIDGCNMGIKKLSEYINSYSTADKEAQQLARRLVEAEEELAEALRVFL